MQTRQFSMLITSPFATGFYIDLNTLLTVKDGSFSNNLNSINEFAKMLNENNHLDEKWSTDDAKCIPATMGREIPLVKTKIPNDEYNELNIQGIECKINFNNNSVTFFPGGVGVFSTEILLNFDKEIDISLARNEIERVIENLITKYEKKVEHLNNHFLEYVNKPFKSLPIIISEYLTNGNFKFRWMHKIYWLYEEKSSDKRYQYGL